MRKAVLVMAVISAVVIGCLIPAFIAEAQIVYQLWSTAYGG